MVTRLDAGMVGELYVIAGARIRRPPPWPPAATDVEISLLRDIVERDLAFAEDPDKLAVNNRLFHETLRRSRCDRYLLKTLLSLHESMALLGRSTHCAVLPERRNLAVRWWRALRPVTAGRTGCRHPAGDAEVAIAVDQNKSAAAVAILVAIVARLLAALLAWNAPSEYWPGLF